MPIPSPPDSQPLILIGAGGHARVVVSCAGRAGRAIGAVLDSDPARIGQVVGGISVQADDHRTEGVFHLAIGSNGTRRDLTMARAGVVWATVIDPDASVANDVICGDGVLIGMGARVQTGAHLGRHVIVNTGAIVEHDSRVGDFAHIAPGAILTGDVRVGEGVMMGAGAIVLPGLSIGDWATIGAGAVVTRSVGAGKTVVGTPARPTEPRR